MLQKNVTSDIKIYLSQQFSVLAAIYGLKFQTQEHCLIGQSLVTNSYFSVGRK